MCKFYIDSPLQLTPTLSLCLSKPGSCEILIVSFEACHSCQKASSWLSPGGKPFQNTIPRSPFASGGKPWLCLEPLFLPSCLSAAECSLGKTHEGGGINESCHQKLYVGSYDAAVERKPRRLPLLGTYHEAKGPVYSVCALSSHLAASTA